MPQKVLGVPLYIQESRAVQLPVGCHGGCPSDDLLTSNFCESRCDPLGPGTEVQEATASWRNSFLEEARGAGRRRDVQPTLAGLCRWWLN